MSIPDTLHYQELREFHSPGNLAFRAACNAVLPTSGKPLKERAIELIHKSDDSHNILVRLWDTHGPVAHDVMAANLAQDLCWKTLVLEKVARESAWRDLFSYMKWDKIFDGAKSLYEKLWDGGNHPAAKTAATVILTVAGYGAAKTLAPQALAIPFTPVWSDKANLPIRFAVDSSGKLPPFQVQMVPPANGLQIPVNLQVNGTSSPIDIELAGSSSPQKAIQDIALQIAATSRSVANASVDLHQLSAHEAEADPKLLAASIGQVADGISDASIEITQVSKKIDSLQSSLKEAAVDEESATEARTAKVIGDLVVISHSTQHGIATLTLRKGQSRAVALPYPDGEKGEISSCTVELTLDGIGQDKGGEYILLRAHPEGDVSASPVHLYAGGSVQILDQPIYRASLNARSRTWLGGQIAELTLTPQAQSQSALSFAESKASAQESRKSAAKDNEATALMLSDREAKRPATCRTRPL